MPVSIWTLVHVSPPAMHWRNPKQNKCWCDKYPIYRIGGYHWSCDRFHTHSPAINVFSTVRPSSSTNKSASEPKASVPFRSVIPVTAGNPIISESAEFHFRTRKSRIGPNWHHFGAQMLTSYHTLIVCQKFVGTDWCYELIYQTYSYICTESLIIPIQREQCFHWVSERFLERGIIR